MTSQIRSILFDFDFTLADSSQGVHDCINFALEKMALAPTSYRMACRTIGLSLHETYFVLTGDKNTAKADEFLRWFVERANVVMIDRTQLFETTPGLMHQIRSAGYSLGIVSTKYRYRIESILSRDQLLDPFDVIIGGEDVTAHKPDPESLNLAISRLEVRPTEVLYVGDSVTDAETAQRAGVKFVAVLTGVTHERQFEKFNVFKIIKDLTALPALL